MDLLSLSNEIDTRIKPKGLPIAFKILEKNVVINYKIDKIDKKLTLCEVMKLVSIHDKLYLIDAESISACVFGPYILGFRSLPESLKDKWLIEKNYSSKGYDIMVKDIDHLPTGKYEKAIFGSFKKFHYTNLNPDGVILFINPTQAYLLLGSYYDMEFKKPYSKFNGHAACEIVASIVKGNSPWLNIPCGGARAMAHVQDDEIWLGMSIKDLESAVERMKKIDSRYPPPMYPLLVAGPHPHHPLTKLLGNLDK